MMLMISGKRIREKTSSSQGEKLTGGKRENAVMVMMRMIAGEQQQPYVHSSSSGCYFLVMLLMMQQKTFYFVATPRIRVSQQKHVAECVCSCNFCYVTSKQKLLTFLSVLLHKLHECHSKNQQRMNYRPFSVNKTFLQAFPLE